MMQQLRRALLLTTAALAALASAPAHANPDSPSVVGGAATVQGVGTSTVIVNQQTDRAIIDWRAFNIGNGELTRFNQPNSGSVILNRVTGGLGPSQILGTLSANGKVFLVNPDGILFGPNSIVNTAGFLGTTSGIKNDDFMAGRYIFQQPGRPDASIVNLGTITATNSGFAALVAPGVRNSGTITANVGSVGLASGNGFTLDFYGDRLITLQVGDQIASSVKDVATGETLDALVKNTGKLSANGGRVELSAVTARQVVDSVINNTGVIEANTVGQKGGQIILGAATESTKVAGAPTQNVKVSGTLSAAGRDAGTKGGKVKITGENIALNGAKIDASGKAGGGKVLIGGDVGGGRGNALVPQAALEREAIANATTVTADGLTVINASAITAGDGGKVVVWSNGATTFYGTVLAAGAGANGKGGFVETSGKYMNVGGATVSAGNGGTWLLDPDDLLIDAALAASISSTLSYGTNVIKETTSTGTGGSGDITVAASINWTTSAMLTLSAYRNIIVNSSATISNSGSGKLVMRADNTGTGTGTVTFNGGTGQVSMTGTGSTVAIYYNPTSYSSPTTYANWVSSPYLGQLTAYMLVNSVGNLQNMQSSGYYALGRDIDATGFTGFPTGSTFHGWLDGQDHTISNATLNGSLLPSIGTYGIIRNLRLSNITVNANADGQVLGILASTNAGTISNVFVSGTINGGEHINLTAGGLVGINTGTGTNIGAITGSHANVEINVGGYTDGAGNSYVGGFVGKNNDGTIQNSSATGSVWLYNAGNLAESNWGQTGYAGGFVGLNQGGSISDSYALGAVGGVSAYRVGGFVGLNGGTINRTYSTGGVTDSYNDKAGAFAGENTTAGIISNSYVDSSTSYASEVAPEQTVGLGSDTGVSSFSNAQASSKGTYAGFDFDNTWFMIEGSTRPFLRSEWSTTIGNAHQLQLIAMDPTASYKLANNINLGTALGNSSGMWGDAGFVPIGNANNPFTGGLSGISGVDSQGNMVVSTIIDGLRINSSAEAVGLFGVIGAGGWVDSIRLTNVAITTSGGSQFVGAIAGINRGAILLSSAAGSIGPGGDASPASSAQGAYGGLVGLNEATTVSYLNETVGFSGGIILGSYANVDINLVGPTSGYIDAGGLVGQNRGIIFASWAHGNIDATYSSGSRTYLGGLVGWNVANNSNTTEGSFYPGGIDYSYATGSITGNGTDGIGGGLVGVNGGGNISTSYSTGSVHLTGSGSITGGLVGQNNGGTALYAYWDTTSSQQSSSALGTGLTTTQFGTLPPGFTSPEWTVSPSTNSGYPYIAVISFTDPPPPTPPPPSPPPSTGDNAGKPEIADNFTQIVTNLPPLNDPPKTGDPVVVVANNDPAGTPGAPGSPRTGRPGDPGTTASLNAPRIPLDKLPSGVPPITETRFVSNEVTLEIEQTVPRDRVEAIARQLGLNVLGAQDFNMAGTSMFRFRLPAGRTVAEIIRAMEAGGNKVGAAQPNYVYSLTQTAPDLSSAQDLSSSQDLSADPASRATGVANPSSLQYSLSKLRLSEVHRMSRGEQIVVAVIDSEVDRTHPDLKSVKFETFDALGGSLDEPHAHGTGMTGAIASRGRILGVAPDVNVLAIKAFGSAGGNTFEIIKGLDWAAAHGAKIVNMSFAGPPDPMLSRALAVARRKGMVLIAAAGNAGPKSPALYPAADPNVIAVTATDLDDKVFPGANRGKYIAVAAPGVDVLALSPGGRYEMSTGTSIATAHVSGLAALLLQRNPTLGHEGVRRILMSTAKDLGPKGVDPDYGAGLVDAYRALTAAGADAPDVTGALRH